VVDGIASGGISAYIESPYRQIKNMNMYLYVLTSSSNKVSRIWCVNKAGSSNAIYLKCRIFKLDFIILPSDQPVQGPHV
jgi:hypothetical protein